MDYIIARSDIERSKKMTVIDKFLRLHQLSKAEYIELLNCWKDKDSVNLLRAEALKCRKQYYGNKVFARGLIEFTNYCKNNCYYCGIRAGNSHIERYRLTCDEIMECCRQGYELGYRTFVLQGADRYLLRQETADELLYCSLHPPEMKLKNRKQCLYDLKRLGYQVGAGFMVGSPKQNSLHIAEDLLFLQEFQPEMVGIGPFVPHHDTVYSKEKPGSVEMTLFLLSVIRIMLPKVLLPATTALGTLDPQGREKGLMAGANVVMPNLSPVKSRKLYELYDNKICIGEEAASCAGCLEQRVKKAGYQLVKERGDAVQ